MLRSGTLRAAAHAARSSSPGMPDQTRRTRPRPPPASSPSSCRARCRRSRSSPSGRPSPASGATASTRCARTSRASRPRSPTRSSPATAGPATSSSTRSPAAARAPLQAAAEGRIGVGNDLNPLAHVLTGGQAGARDARRGTHPARRPPPRAGPPTPPRWLALGRARDPTAPATRPRFVPAAGSGGGPDARAEALPDEVALAFHPRTLGQLLLVRSQLRLDDRTDRFLAGALAGDPPRQDAVLPVHDHAQHVQHGPALRARLRGAERLRAAAARRVRRPRRRSWTACTASRCPAHDRRRAPRRRADGRAPRPGRPARPRPARPGPARRHVAALPARAQVRLLQLAPDLAAGLRRPRHRRRRSTTPTSASRTSRSCARSSPTSGRRSPTTGSRSLVIGDVEMDRGKPSTPGSAWPSGPGRRPRTRRATGSPASSATRWPRTAR